MFYRGNYQKNILKSVLSNLLGQAFYVFLLQLKFINIGYRK